MAFNSPRFPSFSPKKEKGGKQRREISAAPDFMAPIFSPFPLYARSFGERKCGKLGFCSHSAYATVKEGEIMEAVFFLGRAGPGKYRTETRS